MSNPHDITEKLPDGYEGQNIPDNFSIPSCGIEDIDRAMFNLFDKKIGFSYKSSTNNVENIPVLFAGSERFAMLKNKKPIRDKNGIFILPLISITRTQIDQSETLSGIGRGIGQDTGDLVIKTRLDNSDRRYQNIKNKLGLKNQTNVAGNSHKTDRENQVDGSTVGTLGTRRTVGSRAFDLYTGEVMNKNLDDNIIEIITIPFPEFFGVTYEIVFWSQYILQMNSMIEQLMSSYHAQGNQFKLETDKGYWFVGFVDSALTSDNNFDDYTEEERIIRYTFSITTTGYLIAPQHEGQRSPFRRYVSAPEISFGVQNEPGGLEGPRPGGNGTGDVNKFILSDVTEIDKTGEELLGRNHSPYGKVVYVTNPFTGENERKFLRVKTRYQRKGETVLSPADLNDLDYISIES